MSEPIYRCPDCGWEGHEREMDKDCIPSDGIEDEIWSNWICPKCRMWYMLEDYTKVEPQEQP